MSKIEVNTIEPQCGTTLTVGKCTTSVAVPGAATVTGDLKSDSLKAADGGSIISQSGTTITIGASGDTVSLASGASQTGFGSSGAVSWNTTVKTGDFTAVSGEGYFVNTTSGEIDVTLPAGSAGSIVAIKDYAKTWDTNNCILISNGSEKIGGSTNNAVVSTEGLALTFVYIDSTQGWLITEDGLQSYASTNPYLVGTGGNAVVTCGDYKTHIFTGPGTFTVCQTAAAAPNNVVDYLVVAGGGSGGFNTAAGGGGAGGFRMSNDLCRPAPTTSPLANPTGITVTATAFPITVGAGASNPGPGTACQGSPTSFSTITSTGGGYGINTTNQVGGPGGSGGGALGGPSGSSGYPGGTGNSPPVSPPQGSNGGAGYDGVTTNTQGGGGGGAGATGGSASGGAGAPGGAGSYIDDGFVGPTAPSYGSPGPVGSTRYFSGGGGGGTDSPNSNTYPGGAGGGGKGGGPSTPGPERKGDANTGGGGGGGYSSPTANSYGGSGIVMIRYKYQ